MCRCSVASQNSQYQASVECRDERAHRCMRGFSVSGVAVGSIHMTRANGHGVVARLGQGAALVHYPDNIPEYPGGGRYPAANIKYITPYPPTSAFKAINKNGFQEWPNKKTDNVPAPLVTPLEGGVTVTLTSNRLSGEGQSRNPTGPSSILKDLLHSPSSSCFGQLPSNEIFVGVAAVHPGAAPTTHHRHDTISHAKARPVTPGSMLQRDANPARHRPNTENDFCQMPVRTSPSFAQMPNDLVGSQASLTSSIGHIGHGGRSLPRILPDKLNWIHRARFNLLLNAKDDGSDKDSLALMHQQGRQVTA